MPRKGKGNKLRWQERHTEGAQISLNDAWEAYCCCAGPRPGEYPDVVKVSPKFYKRILDWTDNNENDTWQRSVALWRSAVVLDTRLRDETAIWITISHPRDPAYNCRLTSY